MPLIIFQWYFELFFYMRIENYFSRYREFIFGPTTALLALQLKWTGSSLWLPWATILKTLKWRSALKENAKAKHCQGKKQKRFSSFLQNLSGASSLCRSWWGFLDRRFNRGDYEGTSRLVHNSNPYWTWHVCPIELFSIQSCTSCLRLVLHMLAFGTKTQRMRVSPTLKFRKKPITSRLNWQTTNNIAT